MDPFPRINSKGHGFTLVMWYYVLYCLPYHLMGLLQNSHTEQTEVKDGGSLRDPLFHGVEQIFYFTMEKSNLWKLACYLLNAEITPLNGIPKYEQQKNTMPIFVHYSPDFIYPFR